MDAEGRLPDTQPPMPVGREPSLFIWEQGSGISGKSTLAQGSEGGRAVQLPAVEVGPPGPQTGLLP